MKIVVDTNIIISAILFPGSTPDRAFQCVIEQYELILTDTIITELHTVFQRKFPQHVHSLLIFLDKLNFTLCNEAPPNMNFPNINIRDAKDRPILEAALYANIPIIITGDKDFFSLKCTTPQILTATEFHQKYCQ